MGRTARRGRGGWVLGAGLAVVFAVFVALLVVFVVRSITGGPNGAQAAVEAESSVVDVLTASQELMVAGEIAKAEGLLTEAIASYGERADLLLARGDAFVAQEKFAEAYEDYSGAIRQGARGEGTLGIGSGSGGGLSQLHFSAGTIASKAGKVDEAIRHYEAASNLQPKDAGFVLFLAQAQLKDKRFDDARANLLKVTTLDPAQDFAWGTLAELALMRNDLMVAQQHIARAREIEPRAFAWRLTEAKILKRAGNPETALLKLTNLSEHERFRLDVLRLIGECYGLLKRPADAAALYATAADAHPREAEYWFEAALWFERAGDNEAALERARHASMLGHEGAGRVLERLRG